MKLLGLTFCLLSGVVAAQNWATEPAVMSSPAPVAVVGSNVNASPSNTVPAAPPLDYKPVLPEVKWSAGAGAFGIRVGFGTNAALSTQGTGSTATLVAPSVGIAYFLGDSTKLLVDLGAGASFDRNVSFAVNAGLALEILFRTQADALRPLISLGGYFGMASVGSSNLNLRFGAQLGGGAEYFFSTSFSVSGKLLIDVPMGISTSGNFLLQISTFSPAINATWYF